MQELCNAPAIAIPDQGWIATGIPQLDLLTGGLPSGAITEITAGVSAGATSIALAATAHATREGKICAWVDTCDSLDIAGAVNADAVLERLIWIRCHKKLEHAMKSADLLAHSGGFGILVLDLSDVPPRQFNRIPLSWWFRFRRAVDNTPTSLIVISGNRPLVKSACALALEVRQESVDWCGSDSDFRLLSAVNLTVTSRKPVRSAHASLRAATAFGQYAL